MYVDSYIGVVLSMYVDSYIGVVLSMYVDSYISVVVLRGFSLCEVLACLINLVLHYLQCL